MLQLRPFCVKYAASPQRPGQAAKGLMIEAKRIDWLDVAKGGSIILVAIYHSTLYLEAYDLSSYAYIQLNDVLRPIRMPLFFAVSGILSASTVNRSWRTLFDTKIALFAYLLLLWTAFRWLFFGFLHTNIIAPTEGLSIIQLIQPLFVPNNGLWFIWALGIYFVVAKLLSKSNRELTFAASLVPSVLALGGFIEVDNFAHRNVIWYLPFFLAGSWYSARLVRWITRRPVAIGAVSVFMFISLYLTLPHDDWLLAGVGSFLLSSFGLVLGAAVAVLLSKWDLSRSIFSYFGRNTLPIYVAHVMFIAALAAAIAELAQGLPFVRYWSVPVMAACAIAMSLTLRAVCEIGGFGWLYALPTLLVFRKKFSDLRSTYSTNRQ